MDVATWYLGPVGNLRPLVCPERNISMNLVRFGGVHQGLTGARTMDVTGHKYEFGFQWTHMEYSEWAWLEALHTRYYTGPFWLINPMKKNLLSRESAALKRAINSTHGMETTTSTTSYSSDWPTGVGLPGIGSFQVTGGGTGGILTFDEGLGFPAVSGETYWVNFYVKNTAVAGTTSTNTFSINWLDSSGAVIGTPTQVTLGQSGSWTQVSLSSVPPSGAATGFVKVLINTGATYRFAAPVVSIGSAATWEVGGAACKVVIDQLSTSSPRFPLTDCSMTILEV